MRPEPYDVMMDKRAERAATKPMLAQTFQGDVGKLDWTSHIAELKLDGGRCIAYVDANVVLNSRSGQDITVRFPEVKVETTKPAILDGEIVAGSLKFADFASRIHKTKPLDIRIASEYWPCIFYAFDILKLDGQDTTSLPLSERKRLLAETVKANPNFRVLPYTQNGIGFWDKVRNGGYEGMMVKHLASTYQFGKRSPAWLKVKCFQEGIFQVYGVTVGENARASTFGALILGKDGRYVGCCGTGFDDVALRQAMTLLCPLRTEHSELIGQSEVSSPVKFVVQPEVNCEVRFMEYGSGGHLRFPSFRRWVK